MRYIEKDLKLDSNILETGAGTGRYSIALAEKGYDVTSVELVPHNLDIMKEKVKPEHKIQIHEGNAYNLFRFYPYYVQGGVTCQNLLKGDSKCKIQFNLIWQKSFHVKQKH